MTRSGENPASTFSGYPMLLLWLGTIAAAAWGIVTIEGGAGAMGGTVLGLSILFFVLIIAGFYMIQPNQGAVITLFGEYRGTDRKQGLRWIWPWMGKKKVSVRAHNIHSERIKINDLRGNPIDVACNVVWRVADTAQAVFDVDDYKAFVNIQIEAGLRTVGARHPYDDFEEEETTLRGSPDVINSELQVELNERLAVAGIVVDEAGLTHLAYASEIAGTMLRRQQAEAVIAARAKLVMGAVSMVQMALDKLSEDNIVHLDDERRAAMVSNLMVVLCGERDTQPVINAGSLYQ
ncbi:MAG TPA: SPFH domain-containing protein [Alteraurantiacibacter sp.]|jgi:regulator of protease activity HflC (stomatin/prohibitin superfamily)